MKRFATTMRANIDMSQEVFGSPAGEPASLEVLVVAETRTAASTLLQTLIPFGFVRAYTPFESLRLVTEDVGTPTIQAILASGVIDACRQGVYVWSNTGPSGVYEIVDGQANQIARWQDHTPTGQARPAPKRRWTDTVATLSTNRRLNALVVAICASTALAASVLALLLVRGVAVPEGAARLSGLFTLVAYLGIGWGMLGVGARRVERVTVVPARYRPGPVVVAIVFLLGLLAAGAVAVEAITAVHSQFGYRTGSLDCPTAVERDGVAVCLDQTSYGIVMAAEHANQFFVLAGLATGAAIISGVWILAKPDHESRPATANAARPQRTADDQ